MISEYVLIIGAMKSGTTTLFDYLAQHPQIAPASIKEPGFFAFEEKWALGFPWYEGHFDYDSRRHRYALDGSTDYAKHPFCKDVVERLKASAPRRYKLIYIMRNPLRRIESHARHVASTKREIGQCISPRSSHSLEAGISPISLAATRYAYQIDKYSEYYDQGDLLLLTLEQLARDPKTVFTRICEFLEIDELMPAGSALASNVADPQSSSQPVRERLYPLWQSLHRISLVRGLVRSVVPTGIRAAVHRKANTWAHPTGRFSLTADEANSALTSLRPDLRRLRDRYGVDVNKEWGIEI